MNIGIDIDATITKYPEFFMELGRIFRKSGHKVYIITGLGDSGLQRRMEKYTWFDDHSWYDTITTTAKYNAEEKALIGKVFDNEEIVGRYKQRICKELDIDVMFDDKAHVHRCFGDIPIFEVK